MFSFLTKKKNSPPAPQETETVNADDSDDFIFVEPKNTSSSNVQSLYPALPFPSESTSSNQALYPPLQPVFFGGFPVPPGGYPPSTQPFASQSNAPVPYIQGVPFELSKKLTILSDFKVIQEQIDRMMASTADYSNFVHDYDFRLERSVLQEST